MPDVPKFNVIYEQAMLLAANMRKDVIDYYKYSRDLGTSCQLWHIWGNDVVLQARSGTIIQKDVWTMPSLHATGSTYLWIYNHCLLKTTFEVVVDGMCKGVSRNADSIRGLSFGRYAMVVVGIMRRFCYAL